MTGRQAEIPSCGEELLGVQEEEEDGEEEVWGKTVKLVLDT